MKYNCYLCIIFFSLYFGNVASAKTFFLEQGKTETNAIYETQYYNVSLRISKENECFLNTSELIKPMEIISLSLDPFYGASVTNFNSWGVLLTFYINPKNYMTDICMVLSQYTYKTDTNNFTITLDLKQLETIKIDSSLVEVTSFQIWNLKRMTLDIRARGKEKFYQMIKFINPLPRNCSKSPIECPMGRFAYVDETIKNNSIIHVANVNTSSSTIDTIVCENNDSGSFDIVEEVTSLSNIARKISSKTNFCKILSMPRTYKLHIIVSSTVCAILAILLTSFVLWYLSIPKEKTLCVIYCQCKKHEYIAKVLKQFLRFMESNCLVRIIEPFPLNDNECEADGEVLLQSNFEKTEIVIYVPFPNIKDHQRNYDGEMHLQCEKYKSLKKKVELFLPIEDMQESRFISSDWPRNTFRVFHLLQDMPRFIKFIHKCYYPECFEKLFRRKVSGPYLVKMLREQTFTNDHIRALTDPKLIYVTESPEKLLFPNINLDLILSEVD